MQVYKSTQTPSIDEVKYKIEYALHKLNYTEEEIKKLMENLSPVDDKDGLIIYILDSVLCSNHLSCEANSKAVRVDKYEYVVIIESEVTTIFVIYCERPAEYVAYQSVHVF